MPRRQSLFLAFLLLCFNSQLLPQAQLVGVNLAGAEFGEGNLPGTYNVHYTYPTSAEVNYFTGKGMNVFRLPFRWERLQRSAYAEFDAAELSRMDGFVNYATSKGASVILDPHNYARYFGNVIGSANLPVAAFQDFWRRLAEHYKNNSKVIFGLMNEPNSMSSELWRDDANAAIAVIRRTGATNLILVPGNAWTGAHSWTQNWYGTPNATTMLTIVDSLDNHAFEVHQYLDSNSSGTSATCSGATVGSQRLQSFTNWLRQNHKRGFLGEFGVANNQTCLAAVDDMLDHIDANNDVWLGWTWWAAGPWWGSYMYSIEPANGVDKPQMAVLLEHIGNPNAVETPVAQNMPDDFSLSQNYPNPFNAGTTIEFFLVQPDFVRLEIINSLGQNVETILAEELSAGKHAINWNAGTLPSGTYYYRLQTSSGFEVKKLVALK